MHIKTLRVWIIVLTTLIVGVLLPGCRQSGCFFFTRNDESTPFTLVVLPDTQNYTDSSFGGKPEYFYGQTQWIKENKNKLNIVMVAHLGDIVQSPKEDSNWKVADRAFRTIENEVPYILNVGNHDQFEKTDSIPPARESLINTYFPTTRFTKNPLYEKSFGGDKAAHYWPTDKSNNSYLFFTGGGIRFIIISLEFNPGEETMDWANQVVASHPECQCIVVTHEYLNKKGNFNNNQAQKLWDNFVSRHENIFLLLCGHVLGESIRIRTGVHGNPVMALLSDYQNHYIGKCGGGGYLRIMTFFPQKDTIEVKSYSPIYDNYLLGPDSRFDLRYDMKGCTGNDRSSSERK